MIPLPAPWRRFLRASTDIATDSPAYARVVEAFANRNARVLPTELVHRWSADTRRGELEIELVEGGLLSAHIDLIGKYDERVFRWTRRDEDHPSDGAAIAARGALARVLPGLRIADEMAIEKRDVVALMALCAEALGVERVFCAPGRFGSLFVMFVRDLRRTSDVENGTTTDEGRTRVEHAAPSAIEDLSNSLIDLINRQVAAVQIAPDALEAIEPLAAEAASLYDAGAHATALARIAQAKSLLGKFFIDQEPSGWLLTCEGACHVASGNAAAAAEAFRLARRALVVPDVAILRLGLARSERTPQDRQSALSALYLATPARFEAMVTPQEAATMSQRIERIEATRLEDPTAEAALRVSLAERHAHQREAWRLSDEAARHRTERHQLCEQDEIAEATSTASHRDLLLKWFVVPVDPTMGSISSHPVEDPERLESLRSSPADDGAVDFAAVFVDTSGSPMSYRYRMVRRAIPLSGRALWRIAGIWSVWPHEEIALM